MYIHIFSETMHKEYKIFVKVEETTKKKIWTTEKN